MGETPLQLKQMVRQRGSRPRSAWIFFALSVAVFAVSLSQEPYRLDTDDRRQPWACLALLLSGWLGLFDGMVAWLANPALAATWALMLSRRYKKAAVLCGVAALALSLSFMLHRDILKDEAGHRARITGYALGYWLWIASIVVALAGSVVASAGAVDDDRPAAA